MPNKPRESSTARHRLPAGDPSTYRYSPITAVPTGFSFQAPGWITA